MAAFLTIARSIEFGDLKTQKWLVSILASFLSSILLSQPLKVICLTIFVTCLRRKSTEDEDNELTAHLDENEAMYLDEDEEYLHAMNVCFFPISSLNSSVYFQLDNPLSTIRKRPQVNRLTEGEVAHARLIRLRDKRMWQAVREILGFIFLAWTIYTLSYFDRDPNASYQVTHLRNLFLNIDKANNNFTQIRTVDDYWQWLQSSFVPSIRAQEWYNGAPPRNLSGFIADRNNRLIGWPRMRQLRVKPGSSSSSPFISHLSRVNSIPLSTPRHGQAR